MSLYEMLFTHPSSSVSPASALYVHTVTDQLYVADSESLSYPATLEQARSFIDRAVDYDTAYEQRQCFLNRYVRIGDVAYRICSYLLVDGTKIPLEQVMMSDETVRIPSSWLSSRKLQPYLTAPGPFEHAYDLPKRYVDQVIRTIE